MLCKPLIGAFALALVAQSAVAAERVTDEQVKVIIEDIGKGFEVWKEDIEEHHLEKSTIMSARGSITLESFLEDFEKSVENVKDRFQPRKNAANSEVVAVLRLGSDVVLQDRRQNQAPRSTWVPLASKFDALARAYHLTWPAQGTYVQPQRLTDEELAERVEQLKNSSEQLWDEKKNAAENDKAINDATRQSLERSIEQLKEMADGIHSRVESGRPAAVEVGQLFGQVKTVRAALTKYSLFSAGGAWRGIDIGTEALAREFALTKP